MLLTQPDVRAGSPALAFFRIRLGTVGRLYAVVYQDGRGVAEPEGPSADHFVPSIQSRDNGDLIATATVNLYDLLANTAISFTRLLVLDVADNEHGIPGGRVVD